MRVALVHDWLDTWGGGENVLVEFLRLFPGADIYTLVDFLAPAERARLPGTRIRTSVLQRIPQAQRAFRYAAVLWPQVIERFDLSAYDLVVSDSHAIAKGARTRTGQTHVCYCHTPARFAWTMAATYAREAAGAGAGAWTRPLVDRALARFRAWDRDASSRVDCFVANSRHIAGAIRSAWGRDAAVVYPPVDVERFAAAAPGGDRDPRAAPYVTVSRLVPYKRIDVIIDAFRALPDRRLVVVGDGPERDRLAATLPPNVTLAGRLDDEATVGQVAAAAAFLFVAEEDFGIAPVEAQAAGTPVIAYGRGGVLESVHGLEHARPTGLFFDAQTPAALADAVRRFEAARGRIDPAACRERARSFAPARFRAEFEAVVTATLARRTADAPAPTAA
jgi:glycosyltransferase involved in cell wall biosynthesis